MSNLFKTVYNLFKSSGKQGAPSNKKSKNAKETEKLSEYDQSIVRLSEDHIRVINESLNIANESKVPETKVSRLDVAKDHLEKLKNLEVKHTFIEIKRLSEVEHIIEKLELEFLQENYKGIAEANADGTALEKEGKVDEAISVYEEMLSDEVDTPHTYRRLAIIYSKRKEREEELRVLRAAMNNIPTTNSSHHQWFVDRFNKKSGQNTAS